ncbi:JmjC domain-containing protein [Pseudomonas sp. F01002]|uniref:JmjC domain-containing protein n=1 Tax=Pseudomonas sp. F01002 TaxID=2555724 RepID=UPI00106D33A0|nr:cupin domain-containing protein [Pseudomonas sp. F01002]TFB32429.1 cupin [Pseudomonas sp. F01002]
MLIDLGVSSEYFLNNIQEKNFHLRRGAVKAEAFTLADIDNILGTIEPEAPSVNLHNGAFIPESEYVFTYNEVGKPRKTIIKPKFYKLMQDGATLILNRMQKSSLYIDSLCKEISGVVNQETLGNGYLAFNPQAAFGNHWDCHDVFAIQLVGRKRWKIYPPTFELPMPGQTSKEFKSECSEIPILDTVLEAGDLLYVPRGWWHSAVAIGEPTFHVAIGVHTTHISTYVEWVCNKFLEKHIECRKRIGFSDADFHDLELAFDKVRQEIMSEENFSTFKQTIISSNRTSTRFDVGANVFGRGDGLCTSTRLNLSSNYAAVSDESCVVNGVKVPINSLEWKVIKLLSSQNGLSIDELSAQLRIPSDPMKKIVSSLMFHDVLYRASA